MKDVIWHLSFFVVLFKFKTIQRQINSIIDYLKIVNSFDVLLLNNRCQYILLHNIYHYL